MSSSFTAKVEKAKNNFCVAKAAGHDEQPRQLMHWLGLAETAAICQSDLPGIASVVFDLDVGKH